ncbi:MAG: hypothetical protein DBX59_09150 [Bacillota bacterium]|nr:MAG: hypothetical protein DBX59_09150 [Bacillota bacterium]
MLDSFDYKEPRCSQCGGEDFYYPDGDKPEGSIPVDRIIRKIDALFDKNDYAAAGRLLENWESEARLLKDKRGELSVQSELMGYYRKVGNREKGLKSVERGLELVKLLGNEDGVSAATVYLNAATTLKSFGDAARAVPLYEKTEKIYNSQLAENDARQAGLYNNYALALVDLNRYEEAERLYRRALAVMDKVEHGQADAAITYVNMAHLYEVWKKDEDMISACMESAERLLNTPDLPRNGYYAFVCSKCAPSFGYFGYFLTDEDLKNRAKEIYERA